MWQSKSKQSWVTGAGNAKNWNQTQNVEGQKKNISIAVKQIIVQEGGQEHNIYNIYGQETLERQG